MVDDWTREVDSVKELKKEDKKENSLNYLKVSVVGGFFVLSYSLIILGYTLGAEKQQLGYYLLFILGVLCALFFWNREVVKYVN